MTLKNDYELLPGGVVALRLTRGRTALVDIVDLPIIAPYRWCAYQALRDKRWYAVAGIPGTGKRSKVVRLHTLLLPGGLVDHKNGDGLDNRRANIRRATHSQNCQNARLRQASKSGFKGVCWDPVNERFLAQIKRDGRRHFLGRFATAEDAARAYDAAARDLHGEFARLNFPRDGELAARMQS